MALSFGVDTPVVRVTFPPDRRRRALWLLWPALRYRVVSPLVHEQRLNAFQTAVLGLARAGFRAVDDTAERLTLDPELVQLVRGDLIGLSYLDNNGAVTATGQTALLEGFPDPDRTIVTYVYQDLDTATLWPASSPAPDRLDAVWETRTQVTAQLSSDGAPWRIRPLPVPPQGWSHTVPPEAAEVVEAVSRGERLRRQGGGRTRRWDRSAPDRVISRVSLMTEGVPVWIPVALLLSTGRADAAETIGWTAHSPFAGRSSSYLRQLVATKIVGTPALRDRIEQFVGSAVEQRDRADDRRDQARRRQAEERLEDRFGASLRDETGLRDLLIGLEVAIGSARRVGDPRSLSTVIINAWKVYEIMLRAIVAQRRPPRQALALEPATLRARLGQWCEQLGLEPVERDVLRTVKPVDLAKAFFEPRPDGYAQNLTLLGCAVVSAAHATVDHPFGVLAAANPRLLSDLVALARDRNDASHAHPPRFGRERGEAAWRFAQDATAAHLSLPLPDLSPLGAGKDHL
jgi:hypothetical protein